MCPAALAPVAPLLRGPELSPTLAVVSVLPSATCPRVTQCAEWSPVTCYTCPGLAMFRLSASQENISVVKTLSAGKIKLLPELLRRNNFLFTRKY